MKDEKDKNKINFWQNGFTIDETKFSTLISLLIVAFTYLLVTNIINDFMYTDRIFDIVKWLIGGIVGVNGIGALTGTFTKKNDYDNLK